MVIKRVNIWCEMCEAEIFFKNEDEYLRHVEQHKKMKNLEDKRT